MLQEQWRFNYLWSRLDGNQLPVLTSFDLTDIYTCTSLGLAFCTCCRTSAFGFLMNRGKKRNLRFKMKVKGGFEWSLVLTWNRIVRKGCLRDINVKPPMDSTVTPSTILGQKLGRGDGGFFLERRTSVHLRPVWTANCTFLSLREVKGDLAGGGGGRGWRG